MSVFKSKLVKLGGAVALSAYGVSKSIFGVKPGQSAILVDRKDCVVKDKVFGEGKHFRLPWFQMPIVYHANRCFLAPIECREDKCKEIPGCLKIVANPVPEYLPNLYRQVGDGDNFDHFMVENIYGVLDDDTPEISCKEYFTEEGVMLEIFKKRFAERFDGLNITLDLAFVRN